MDKRETVPVFRERLAEVIQRSGQNRAAFARESGIERSTLSQLLSPENDRLPRAETLTAIARHQQVSVDWLLGLSQEGQLSTEVMEEPLEVAQQPLAVVDERLLAWQSEAVGYKIRYVPSSLPDLMKTEAVISHEFQDLISASPEQRVELRNASLAYQRRPETDMEVCQPWQDLRDFAMGAGIWHGLSTEVRREQLEHIISLAEELYPTFRWFLYDGRRHYSAALTVFGPLRSVIYVGRFYFVLNSTEHIRELTRHFDNLIRHAVVQPPEVPDYLRRLLAVVDDQYGEVLVPG